MKDHQFGSKYRILCLFWPCILFLAFSYFENLYILFFSFYLNFLIFFIILVLVLACIYFLLHGVRQRRRLDCILVGLSIFFGVKPPLQAPLNFSPVILDFSINIYRLIGCMATLGENTKSLVNRHIIIFVFSCKRITNSMFSHFLTVLVFTYNLSFYKTKLSYNII